MTTVSPAGTTGKTPAGKAISARNATTHGLFCRQTVLPHPGEDPTAFQTLLDALGEQRQQTEDLPGWAMRAGRIEIHKK